MNFFMYGKKNSLRIFGGNIGPLESAKSSPSTIMSTPDSINLLTIFIW
jgi:hypothetical protein